MAITKLVRTRIFDDGRVLDENKWRFGGVTTAKWSMLFRTDEFVSLSYIQIQYRQWFQYWDSR